MEQFLRITSTQAKLAFTVNQGTLSYNGSNPEHTITREKGGLSMKSTQGKVSIDSFDSFNSINPTTKTVIAQNSDKGKQAAFSAGQAYSSQGAMFLRAQAGEDVIEQIVQNSFHVDTNFGITFTPSAPPKISFEPGTLKMDYQMDKLKFNWRVLQGDFEYIPSSINFNMEQIGDVDIEYIAGPIYVPKSSGSN